MMAESFETPIEVDAKLSLVPDIPIDGTCTSPAVAAGLCVSASGVLSDNSSALAPCPMSAAAPSAALSVVPPTAAAVAPSVVLPTAAAVAPSAVPSVVPPTSAAMLVAVPSVSVDAASVVDHSVSRHAPTSSEQVEPVSVGLNPFQSMINYLPLSSGNPHGIADILCGALRTGQFPHVSLTFNVFHSGSSAQINNSTQPAPADTAHARENSPPLGASDADTTHSNCMSSLLLKVAKNIYEQSYLFGMTVPLFTVALVLFAGFYGYIYSIVQERVPLWVLWTSTWFITCYLITAVFKITDPKKIIAIIAPICFLLANLHADDFVPDTQIPARFNHPVYQAVEYAGSRIDPSFTAMDPFFALRKIAVSCSVDRNSHLCAQDLKEGVRVSKTTMHAVHNVLLDPRVVEPRDVYVKGELGSIFPIQFESTVQKHLTQSAPMYERDLHETYLCTLMSMRLKDGLHYYKEFKPWIKGSERANTWLDTIEKVYKDNSAYELWLVGSFYVPYSYVKMMFDVSKKLIQSYMLQQDSVVQWAMYMGGAHKTLKHSDDALDFCTVERCVMESKAEKTSKDRAYIQALLNARPSNSGAHSEQNGNCPAYYAKVLGEFSQCEEYVPWCLANLDMHANRTAPACPEHCKETVYINETHYKKRCEEYVKDLDCLSTCPTPEPTTKFENPYPQHVCTTLQCHAWETVSTTLNFIGTLTATGTGVVFSRFRFSAIN